MTIVRIARAERRSHPGRRTLGRCPTHVVVLADDAGQRELPVWLLNFDGEHLRRLLDQGAGPVLQAADEAVASTSDELTSQLLRAAGASVTGVDIDELGPEVTAARIELSGPGRKRRLTARLAEGLALAITTGAPVRVAAGVLDRLAVPSGQADQATGLAGGPVGGPAPASDQPASATGEPGAAQELGEAGRSGGAVRPRPRYEPQNMSFADGLIGWQLGGSFTEHFLQSHWEDYTASAQGSIAVIRSAVPQPEGFAILGQEVFADEYHGATLVFRGEFRVFAGRGRAALALRVNEGHSIRGPLTEKAVVGDPDNNIVTIPDASDWTPCEVAARVPDDSDAIVFGVFLAGPGRIELRNAELTRA